jgi:hypothetical protein
MSGHRALDGPGKASASESGRVGWLRERAYG